MKAIVVRETGEADALQVDEIPTPEPGAAQVRVKVEAAGQNFIDIYHRRAIYPLELPFTPGLEGAGIVDAVGEGVSEFSAGDKVAWTFVMGSYAEYLVAPADQLVAVPDGITGEQAGAVMLQGLTAHYLSRSTYPIAEGETALVTAAAGGVGQLLTQMIKMAGGTVLGLVGSREKADLAKSVGADETILYKEVDFEEEVKRLTDGAGVEVVYESVGKATFAQSLNCLKPRGYMVLYGQASGQVDPIDPQILNAGGSLFLTRPSLGHYTLTREELLSRTNEVFGWMLDGKLAVTVDKSFALADAPDAHRYMEDAKTMGKVLLTP